jgi:spermidine synthase
MFGFFALLTGAAGMAYEYIIGTTNAYLLGDAILQLSVIMGIMVLVMGIVCLFQSRLRNDRLVEWFIVVELLLVVIGGFAPLTLQWLFTISPDSFSALSYLYAAIVGFLIGIEIPLIMRINEKFAKDLSQNIANTWSLDYFGAVVGLAAWILMLKFGVSITNISFCIAALNMAVVIAALWFFWRRKMLRGWNSKALLLSLTVIVGIGTIFGAANADALARSLTQKLYDDPIVLHETTLYQDIVMTQGPHPSDPLSYNYELFLNGNKQFASADERIYHEYLVHPAMTIAASRERVLILGGGDGLALREVLKYDDVQDITLVDLDPGMIELASTNEILQELNDDAFADARVHSNLEDAALNSGITTTGTQDVLVDTGESRVTCEEVSAQGTTGQCATEPVLEKVATVNVYTIDADKFISAAGGYYDVIIVDLPDPNSVELAKLYSEEFYSKVGQALSPSGIVTVQATSPYHAKETYLCILRTMTAAGLNSLPYHDNVPSFGDWGWFIGSLTLSEDQLYELLDTMESFGAQTEKVTATGLTRALIFNQGQFETANTTISTVMNPVVYDYYTHEGWKTN